MNLGDLLNEKRSKIVEVWFQRIAETYPHESAQFLRAKGDRFANPLGSTIRSALGPLFDEFLGGEDTDRVSSLLDDIIRIRAVQEFAPSAAVGVVHMLKQVVRDEFAREIKEGDFSEELATFEGKIDQSVLLAFDVYMSCRERLWQVKMNDFMKRPTLLAVGGMCPSYMLRREQRKQGGPEEDKGLS
jgi:hypothetical protein